MRLTLKSCIRTACSSSADHLKKTDKAIKIIYADSMEAAEILAAKDPFTAEGYYPHTEIYELAEANEENNYLLR